MTQLTGKWKLYRVAAAIYLCLGTALLILLVVAGDEIRADRNEAIIFVLFLFFLLLSLVSSSLSLFILAKFFPLKSPRPGLRTLHLVLLICSTLLMVFLAFAFFYGLTREMTSRDKDPMGLYILLYLFVLLSAGFYCLIQQYFLIPFLKQSEKKSLNNLVDQLGEPETAAENA